MFNKSEKNRKNYDFPIFGFNFKNRQRKKTPSKPETINITEQNS